MKRIHSLIIGIALAMPMCGQNLYPYQDVKLPIDQRVSDLVSRMTLDEKISQMMNTSKAIDRLGIPDYNWWNECLHGVARSGDKVTVFPQPIGLAATFNPEGLERSAEMISDEGRAVYHEALRRGDTKQRYRGLTFWTPNINIFRDPRWGRGHETYGEDPYLTTQLGKAMVKGLQGDNPNYLKTSACAKHYAVHSGPEPLRHEFNAKASEHDLWDTYLPAFRSLIKDTKVSGVMCAYNRYNDQACCGSDKLMRSILLNEWKFDGYVTSDCWAIIDFVTGHKTHKDSLSAAADAVLHGTDLECGQAYKALGKAVKAGLITEEQVDISLKKLFKIRFRLGMFDPDDMVPYAKIPYSILEAEPHQKQALEMARQSIVLLKNEKKLLPLSSKTRKIGLVGPNANNAVTQLGNYHGIPSKNVTLLDALRAEKGIEVVYDSISDFTQLPSGCDLPGLVKKYDDVDLIIYVGGISCLLEGEEGDAGGIEGFSGGDRLSIDLPKVQTDVMKEFRKLGKPLVFICMSGGSMAFNWEVENANAVIQAWYGGQAAGTAIADILFGRYNPSGRLPVTFYKADSDLPPIGDYSMKGRTYRYYNGDVLYPFGYGLSYTTFKYGKLASPDVVQIGDSVRISVEVANTGKVIGDEVVQLYLSHQAQDPVTPICQLAGFKRVTLHPGERKLVNFVLSPRELGYIDECGDLNENPGTVNLYVGGVCPTAPKRFVFGTVSGKLTLTGTPLPFAR